MGAIEPVELPVIGAAEKEPHTAAGPREMDPKKTDDDAEEDEDGEELGARDGEGAEEGGGACGEFVGEGCECWCFGHWVDCGEYCCARLECCCVDRNDPDIARKWRPVRACMNRSSFSLEFGAIILIATGNFLMAFERFAVANTECGRFG
mmetsp:Transcript_11551/g.22164  ORF Transcript_11551/g.22164 Transcript_11551/m.22164 type:complete len:150 (+) Transcript_11551:418-867(+)